MKLFKVSVVFLAAMGVSAGFYVHAEHDCFTYRSSFHEAQKAIEDFDRANEDPVVREMRDIEKRFNSIESERRKLQSSNEDNTKKVRKLEKDIIEVEAKIQKNRDEANRQRDLASQARSAGNESKAKKHDSESVKQERQGDNREAENQRRREEVSRLELLTSSQEDQLSRPELSKEKLEELRDELEALRVQRAEVLARRRPFEVVRDQASRTLDLCQSYECLDQRHSASLRAVQRILLEGCNAPQFSRDKCEREGFEEARRAMNCF